MKLKKLAQLIALMGAVSPAIAQTAVDTSKMQRVEITGSSIKRIAKEGALPLEIISRKQLEDQGIVSAEQLIATLNINGNGSDNLASNADVTSGAQRGNNGASSANLRGQGADSTLVLLNGRRVATHGMKGSAVDLNSIPMSAVERVEVLKDGASAIYGTDAIGGVINFILKKNYRGLETQAFVDVTEAGGSEIGRASITGGWGDLDTDGWNVLATFSHRENKALRGDQRDFVNTFQPDRGVSVDTRGTPSGNVFATTIGPSLLSRTGTGPTIPGGGTTTYSGISILDLPGGPGCNSIDGMGPYDEKLWNSAGSAYGCAWDTGRAAVLQQPVKSSNALARATFQSGDHQFFVEAVGSNVEVAKRFSPNQISPGTTTFPASSFYPRTGAAYDTVYNALVKVFPSVSANYGLPIAYRWRCMECGNREIVTESKAARLLVGADGPVNLFGKRFDYRTGISRAFSESESLLGTGYNYTVALANALGTGKINPFLLPGQQQSQEAIDLIKSTSAAGVTMYGGRTTLTQLDGALSGELFNLPAGTVMGAVGFDLRREGYEFNGDRRAAGARPVILNAPFDDPNALDGVHRDIKAVYAELLVPVINNLDVTLAIRRDHYSGIGATTNPKISFRYQPIPELLFRGSYNEGFRAPSFNQLYNGVTESPYAGKDLVDPSRCPTGLVDATKPGCESITPNIFTGGKSSLGPETAKQGTVGVVIEPFTWFSANADIWEVRKQNTIDSFSTATMVANYNLFSENFIRDASGNIAFIDQRWVNAGERTTRGLELGARLNGKFSTGAIWTIGMDGSRLLEKKSRATTNAEFGKSEVGRFTFTGDLGLKWKHSAYVTYKYGNWSGLFQNIYRSGYDDQVLPGVANGLVKPTNYNPKVDDYSIFNLSVSYSGIKSLTLTAGVKNIFDEDPPFAITYDGNTGAGSSWEPRVADPRGRAFTLMATYKFF
ncbi:TonB-dependent receptor domain-containing protein [Massilia yuzhufengensis]|uniref:Iron complex outermembrane recepter protein n=1 Tax=Massilia yuzhufengensis TaxID=1164594 RepID=A0A1I1D4Z9_9BURK|nr:TonB-dependent receptor [Massilia yuzhufengensis]SFB70099.1 iron complex outermembrane recepter protein [Massilia yuzhufengensis]